MIIKMDNALVESGALISWYSFCSGGIGHARLFARSVPSFACVRVAWRIARVAIGLVHV